MKLFLISQGENHDYDSYDSAVVATEDEETARQTDPSTGMLLLSAVAEEVSGRERWGYRYSSWCSAPEAVTVQYIGEAVEGTLQGVVCASFNAG